MLKMIVCVDNHNGIGKANKIPWNNSKEMQHFKQTTLNKIVVMGRKTYESIGRLLPNRKNIIFSNQKNLSIPDAIITSDLHQIIELAKQEDVFIIGGAEIYKLFENYYDELIISEIDDNFKCDTFLKINMKFYNHVHTKQEDGFKVKYYEHSYKQKLLYGSICANTLKKKLVEQANELQNKFHAKPCLCIVQVGNDYASSVYVNNKIKLAKSLGVEIKHLHFPNTISEIELINAINGLNLNKSIHGILVQLPLPKHINKFSIINTIDPNKDVDGFCFYNIGRLWANDFENALVPCTPQGIITLLDFYNIPISSKNVVIIGRSDIVSKPLISLFLSRDATVQVCHSKTKDLMQITKQADIIVVAIGKLHMLDHRYFKKGSIVIDVGINHNGKGLVSGDVDIFDVIDNVDFITPVPFGVGPMTLIMLFKNLLICYKLQYQERNK